MNAPENRTVPASRSLIGPNAAQDGNRPACEALPRAPRYLKPKDTGAALYTSPSALKSGGVGTADAGSAALHKMGDMHSDAIANPDAALHDYLQIFESGL